MAGPRPWTVGVVTLLNLGLGVSAAQGKTTMHLDAGSWTSRLQSRLQQERPELEFVAAGAAEHRVTFLEGESPRWFQLVVVRAPSEVLLTRAIDMNEGPGAIVRLATLLILQAIDTPEWARVEAPPAPEKPPSKSVSGVSIAAVAAWWQEPFLPHLGFSLGLHTVRGRILLELRAELRGILCCQREAEGLTGGGYEMTGLLQGGWAVYSEDWVGRLIFGVGANFVRWTFQTDPAMQETLGLQTNLETIGRFGFMVETPHAGFASMYLSAGIQVRLSATSVNPEEDNVLAPLDTGAWAPWIELGTRLDFF